MAEQTYGGFWARLFAYICDSLIALALAYLVIALLLKAGFDIMGLAVNLAAFLTMVLYFALMQSSSGQATVGKKLLGLQVAAASGERASLGRNIGRELAKILSTIPFMLGFLMAAFTGRKQGLHDLVASTVVLDVGPAKPLKGFAVVVLAVIANVAIIFFLLADAFTGAMQQAMAGVQQQATVTTSQPVVPMAQKPAVPVAPKVAPAPVPVAAAPAAAEPPKPVVVGAAKPAMVEIPKTAPLERVAAVKPAPAPSPAPDEKPRAAAPAAARVAAPPPVSEARPGTPGPKYNDLMTAVVLRDAAAVSELIAFGRWPDKPDSQGVTPLMAAARLGDATNAEALLKAGANPDAAMPIARERRDSAMTALLERYATSRRP